MQPAVCDSFSFKQIVFLTEEIKYEHCFIASSRVDYIVKQVILIIYKQSQHTITY